VVGGGLGTVIVVIAVALLSGGRVDLSSMLGDGSAAENVGTVGQCSADQANTDRECRLSAAIDSLDTYWDANVEGASTHPKVWEFSDSTDTGCGTANSSTGPFYCPPDQAIYLDLGFFDQLSTQFGARGGPLAEMYVIAHEYGHHIQQIAGVMDRAERDGAGSTSDSVRVELQADCYAGLWAGHAAKTADPDTGVTYLEPISDDELSEALDAAAAVGDDHIQEQSGGGVNPDTWTHGSSAQRQKWFTIGYEKGTLAACDTFSAKSL